MHVIVLVIGVFQGRAFMQPVKRKSRKSYALHEWSSMLQTYIESATILPDTLVEPHQLVKLIDNRNILQQPIEEFTFM